MKHDGSKIDEGLLTVLDTLTNDQHIEVLIYPTRFDDGFEKFLETEKARGVLDYNVLKLANCVVIKAAKVTILDLAARDEIVRIISNPVFTAY